MLFRIYSEAEVKEEGVAVHCRGGNGRTGTVSFIFVVVLMVVVVEIMVIMLIVVVEMVIISIMFMVLVERQHNDIRCWLPIWCGVNIWIPPPQFHW